MYSILKIQKIKSKKQLFSVQQHNLRLMKVENADEERKNKNITLGAKSYYEISGKIDEIIQLKNIKPRKDAVIATEVLLTASPEFFKQCDQKKFKAWLQENYKWAKEEFGENLLQFTVHLDETTPHIHLVFIPITKDGRLSMRDMYGGANKLRELQTRYACAMQKFGLIRGQNKNEENKAEFKTIKKYYNLINKLKKLKKEQKNNIINQIENFDIQNKIDGDINIKDFTKTEKINTENSINNTLKH